MAAQCNDVDSLTVGNLSQIDITNNENGGLSIETVNANSSKTNDNKDYNDVVQSKSDEFEEKPQDSTKDEVAMVLSILYGIFVVILAIVFKVAEKITHDTQLASKQYQCVLFSIAILWLIAFKLYSMWHRRVKGRSKFSRSPHASNKWLKGVIALFGFAIVVKDSLEVIGVAEVTNPSCKYRMLYYFKFILHALFVLGQVVFLFFYSKIHIHEFKVCSRFGVMHAMATNLAVWIDVIADETSHAIKIEKSHDSPLVHPLIDSLQETNITVLVDSIESYCSNTSQLYAFLQMDNVAEVEASLPSRDLFSGECACRTPVCNVISRAEAFLSPLLIEFCLVSSCLLYCIWNHIGKKTVHHKDVAKPSHKFYKSYKGVMLGALVLVATVIVVTLLGTLDSGTPPVLKSYYTEMHYLAIFEDFLLVCNMAILLACFFAFYIYTVSYVHRSNASVSLDSVLLFICLVGPLMVGLFAILALCAGSSSSKGYNWIASLAYSLTDVITSIVQVQLIVYGLHREKATGDETTPNLVEQPCVRENPNRDRSLSFESQSISKQRAMYSFEAVDAHNQTAETSLSQNNQIQPVRVATDVNNVSKNEQPTDVAKEQQSTLDRPQGSQSVCNNCTQYDRRKTLLAPNKIRLILREIIMFLVFSNTCLWMFLSLNGTMFKVYVYQAEYFGHSAWTTLVSVTAPLSIFLKLHFAACYFEMWSYS